MKKVITQAVIAFLSISETVMAQTPPATPPVAAEQPRTPRPEQNISNNGLHGSLNVHDPCMIKAGDTYYVLTTGMNMKSSKDMVNWVNAGSVLNRTDSFPWWNDDIPGKVGLWAPDIHYADGKYHLYYSVSAWMNFKSSVGYGSNVTLKKNNTAYKWVD